MTHFRARRIGLAIIALAACHASRPTPSTPATTASANTPLVRGSVSSPIVFRPRSGDVSEFVPAVAAIDTGGRCETIPNYPMLQSGQRPLHYTFGARGHPFRNVMLIVDSAGQPVRYSDLRGDLRGNPDPALLAKMSLGPRTTITINMADQSGVLRNLDGRADSVGIRVRGSAVLTAANLGPPAAMIARILRECAGRAPSGG